jgi:hypothetical protein
VPGVIEHPAFEVHAITIVVAPLLDPELFEVPPLDPPELPLDDPLEDPLVLPPKPPLEPPLDPPLLDPELGPPSPVSVATEPAQPYETTAAAANVRPSARRSRCMTGQYPHTGPSRPTRSRRVPRPE